MKIAVSASGNTIDAAMDPRFGRCAYFVVVDSETSEFQAIENTGATQGSGAGISAAQAVGASDAEAVVAGNFGPNAFGALSAAGIAVYQFAGGTVRDAVEAVIDGTAQPVGDATVGDKAGLKGDFQTPPTQQAQSMPGMGAGAGMGRGMGGGCGMGRGMGQQAGYDMGYPPYAQPPMPPQAGFNPWGGMVDERQMLQHQLRMMQLDRQYIGAQIEFLQQQANWLDSQIAALEAKRD